jgi:hypothetical protein
LVIVSAFAITTALVAAPTAFGAGDPIASGNVKLKLSGGFKKQLKKNHVRMKPKSLKITGGSNLDPTTGQGLLRVGKITFKKGGKKLVFKNSKATLGANGAKGSITGNANSSNIKIFKLSGGTIVRNGFGANVNGIKLKFQKGAAKKINKALGLNSLHKGSAGKASLDEKPTTVQATGGYLYIEIPQGFLPTSGLGANTEPNAVTNKNPAHCLGPAQGTQIIADTPGSDPSNPARISTALGADPVLGPPPAGDAAILRFPVTGGTIGPDGKAGALQTSGGIRLLTGRGAVDNGLFGASYGANCLNPAGNPPPSTSNARTYVEVTRLGPNLQLANVQVNTLIGGTKPGCNFTDPNAPAGCGSPVGVGDVGVTIGQTLDLSKEVVTSDPNAKTVSYSGVPINNNGTTAQVFNTLFPNGGANTALNFADGDKFGITKATVNVR